MKILRRTLALAMCIALLLTGCTFLPARDSSSTPQQNLGTPYTGPVAPAAELYALSVGGDEWSGNNQVTVLTRDGEVAMQGRGLQLLRDNFTGLTQAIAKVRHEPQPGAADATTFSALYDLEGNLIADWQPVTYIGGFGNYVEAIHMNDGEYFASLYNIQTRQSNYRFSYLTPLSGQKTALYSSDNGLLGILDAEGNEIWGFPADAHYTWVSTAGNMVLLQRENPDCTLVLDEDLNVIWESDSSGFVEIYGEYASRYLNNGETSQIFTLSGGEPVHTLNPGEYLYYFDGDVMLYSKSDTDFSYHMANAQGEPLWEDCTFIQPACPDGEYSAEYFLACKDNMLMLLDAQGKIVQQRPCSPSTLYATYLDNMFSVQAEEEISTEEGSFYEASCELLDMELNPLQPYGKYETIFTTYMPGGAATAPYYSALQQRNGHYSYNHILYDLLDADGNVLLENIRVMQECGNDRFVVFWGFDCGLIDESGTWLYRTSAFGVLEDE